MPDENQAGACGLYCGECKHFGKKCQGCGREVGKPFWAETVNIDICHIYKCCVFDKKHDHCGKCRELPCELFIKFRDPDLSDEGAEISLKIRQQDLKIRKRIGTAEWLIHKEKAKKKK